MRVIFSRDYDESAEAQFVRGFVEACTEAGVTVSDGLSMPTDIERAIALALGSDATEADARKFIAEVKRLGYEIVIDGNCVDLVRNGAVADEGEWHRLLRKIFD